MVKTHRKIIKKKRQTRRLKKNKKKSSVGRGLRTRLRNIKQSIKSKIKRRKTRKNTPLVPDTSPDPSPELSEDAPPPPQSWESIKAMESAAAEIQKISRGALERQNSLNRVRTRSQEKKDKVEQEAIKRKNAVNKGQTGLLSIAVTPPGSYPTSQTSPSSLNSPIIHFIGNEHCCDLKRISEITHDELIKKIDDTTYFTTSTTRQKYMQWIRENTCIDGQYLVDLWKYKDTNTPRAKPEGLSDEVFGRVVFNKTLLGFMKEHLDCCEPRPVTEADYIGELNIAKNFGRLLRTP